MIKSTVKLKATALSDKDYNCNCCRNAVQEINKRIELGEKVVLSWHIDSDGVSHINFYSDDGRAAFIYKALY